MEPVIEEEASRKSLPGQVSRNGSLTAGKAPPFSVNRNRATGKDHPSIKYKDIEPVSKVVLQRALSPPKPVLPRRSGLRTWNATAKERHPLAASLTGPGRAGKYTKLIGDAGGVYEGEVLAGRPHGNGRYLASKGPGSDEHVLQYEGEWIQGRREGLGTRYYLNGEQYVGQFVSNIRHGTGRYFFTNGDMYVGSWLDDKRTGKGTYFYATGDIFSGNFLNDKKEGMGILFMMDRQKKYVAEYVNGSPKCGTVLGLEDDDLEPLKGQLAALAIHKKLDLAASGRVAPQLPELELKQPNKVLATQIVAVRRDRSESRAASLRAVQDHSGTLGDRDLEMLRHSYTLMAAGDDLHTGLLPHQLRELCVMAGLDPAADLTRNLVEELLTHRDERSGRIAFDAFLKVVLHFRSTEADDLPEPSAPSMPATDMEEDSYLPAGPPTGTQPSELSGIPLSNTQTLDQDGSLAMYSEASMQHLAEGPQFLTEPDAVPVAEQISHGQEQSAVVGVNEASQVTLKADAVPAQAPEPVAVAPEPVAAELEAGTGQQAASDTPQQDLPDSDAPTSGQSDDKPSLPDEQDTITAVPSSRPCSGGQDSVPSPPPSSGDDVAPVEGAGTPELASVEEAGSPDPALPTPDADVASACETPAPAPEAELPARIEGTSTEEAAVQAEGADSLDAQEIAPAVDEAAPTPDAGLMAVDTTVEATETAPQAEVVASEPGEAVAEDAQPDSEPAPEADSTCAEPPLEATQDEPAGVLDESGLQDAPAEQQADELVTPPAGLEVQQPQDAATDEVQLQPDAVAAAEQESTQDADQANEGA